MPTTTGPVKEPAEQIKANLDGKLKSITLNLDFSQATIEEAVSFLTIESKEQDPAHSGVQFVIRPEAAKSTASITLALKNVSLGDALQQICDQAKVKFKTEDSLVCIVPLSDTSTDPTDTRLLVPPDGKLDAATQHKLDTIIIDRLNFQKLEMAIVVKFLAAKSRELDPDHQGLNFVLGNIAPTDPIESKVSLDLRNIQLAQLVKIIAEQTHLHYSIENGIVVFKP